MTRLFIWVFQVLVSLAAMFPDQQQATSTTKVVEVLQVDNCKIYVNYSDFNTFKRVEDSKCCLL